MSKVGQPIWVHDSNHRVYARDANGKTYGAPLERHMWVKHEIVNETTQSYIIDGWGTKIPKKKEKQFGGVAFSEEEVEEFVYVAENRYKIAEAVRKADYKQLKQIEEILQNKPVK